MQRMSRHVRVGGEVLVSVPTPRCARVFGKEFHRAVGHLVDGYDLSALNALAPSGLTVVQYRYSTGLFAWAPCALFYRLLRRLPNSTIVSLLRLSTLPFTAVDFLNGPHYSCSLFAPYQRV
jgi:hypothetical protein